VNSFLIIPGYRPDRIVRFAIAFLRALFSGKSDLIVIQRVSSNWIYSNALKLLASIKKNVAYDLDDADYLLDNADSIYTFAKKSSKIFAGSEGIAKHLSAHNKNIVINTSAVPYTQKMKTVRNSSFTIGWIGEFGGEHKAALYQYLFPAIRLLKFPCVLKVIGIVTEADRKEIVHYFKDHTNVELMLPMHIDWLDEDLIHCEVASFDVGIATLMDSAMHRSKSGFKVKQYLNHGIPVLCNNLQENNRYVKHGWNGFLCNSSDEFCKQITHLREMDSISYEQFSQNARNSIAPFTLDKYCTTLCGMN
jgi:hypothetical protein